MSLHASQILNKSLVKEELHDVYDSVIVTKMEQDHYRPSLFKSVFLAICFMLVFTAFNSAQNQVSTLYTDLHFNSLGNIALMALYLTFGFSCFIAT